MPIYHVVLFKLKPSISETGPEIENLKQTAKTLVGKIPGLEKLDIGAPHVSTAHRSQGYQMGIVAILDKPETIQVYADHPEHLKIHEMRKELCTDALAFDLEFER